MAHSDNTSLHFTCPRCMSSLKSPPNLAKSKHRCPRCQLVIEVPEQSRKPVKADGYGLQHDAGPRPTAQPAYIPVICHVCHTRMYGAPEQIGQALVCPDCGTATVVQPPTGSPHPAAKHVTLEEYPLLDEVHPAAGDRHAYEKSLIRVMCDRCNTMMYAEANQVGQKLICPDCGTSTIVPRPDDKLAKKPHEIDQYPLVNEVDRTAGEKPAGEQSYIVACCSLCQTRLDVSLDQAGRTLTCPDCGRPVVVPSKVETGQGRGARDTSTTWHEPPEPPARPEFVPNRDYRDPKMLAEREAERIEQERAARLGTRGIPPLQLFFAGTFTFPFSPEPLGRSLSLMGFAILTPVMLGFGLGDFGANIGLWIGQLFVVLCAAGLLLAWIVTASAFGLAILRGTADGVDVIRHYPNVLALEGLLEPVYLVFAVIYGATPGMFLLSWWQPSGISGILGIGISQLLFTPICLLSMLEANTLLNPFSPPVWRSVIHSWLAWAIFYVLSFALIIAMIAIQTAAVALGGPILGIIVAGVTVTMAWIVYFRLLGRLAWFCSGQQPPGE